MIKICERLKGKTILIVDDDSRNIFALVSYMDGMEMEIHTAGDGLQAIEELVNNVNIEMILMDMMMPEMDGFETMARIKKTPSTADIPIIALTAKAMKGDRDKCMGAGASDYVSKPVNMRELLGKMADMLNPTQENVRT